LAQLSQSSELVKKQESDVLSTVVVAVTNVAVVMTNTVVLVLLLIMEDINILIVVKNTIMENLIKRMEVRSLSSLSSCFLFVRSRVGYSESITCDENYVIRIPDNLDFTRVAPLLCAGITTYSPLMHYGVRPNQRVAIAGLGGLGHMGVKFAVAFGCHVTVLSRGTAKKESALNHLGAHAYLDVRKLLFSLCFFLLPVLMFSVSLSHTW
jgi:hypothetical protein